MTLPKSMRNLIVLVGLLAVVVLILICSISYYSTHSASLSAASPISNISNSEILSVINTLPRVEISEDAQKLSGIEVAPVTIMSYQPHHTAYATVIDLQPLFELSSRLASARANRDSAFVQAETSETKYNRIKLLYKNGNNLSLQTLQDAQAAAQTDRAMLQSSEIALGNTNASLRQQFGEVLTKAANTPTSGLFQDLRNNAASVISVALSGASSAPAPSTVEVISPSALSISAGLLSAAPHIDSTLQASAYFYVVKSALPVGSVMSAQVKEGSDSNGLFIPESALLWYGGERWVYVAAAKDRFVRHLIANAFATEQGVVVTTGFSQGDIIVTKGAQLLLSEEQRPQGIATQCKDPPECDN
jgi:multidrug efflux system membrane fusion protein